jgi:hypothetical protein
MKQFLWFFFLLKHEKTICEMMTKNQRMLSSKNFTNDSTTQLRDAKI